MNRGADMNTLIASTVLVHSFATVALLVGVALAACLPARGATRG
jgi:hypothetical protein